MVSGFRRLVKQMGHSYYLIFLYTYIFNIEQGDQFYFCNTIRKPTINNHRTIISVCLHVYLMRNKDCRQIKKKQYDYSYSYFAAIIVNFFIDVLKLAVTGANSIVSDDCDHYLNVFLEIHRGIRRFIWTEILRAQ